jgi:hypothetical protein
VGAAAVEVARRDGVNQTAAALHLDGGKLKRRMMATGPVPDKTMPPTFVEMMVPHAVGEVPTEPELPFPPAEGGTYHLKRCYSLGDSETSTAHLRFFGGSFPGPTLL